jgi:hypothetical protein
MKNRDARLAYQKLGHQITTNAAGTGDITPIGLPDRVVQHAVEDAAARERRHLAACILAGLVRRAYPPDEQRAVVREAYAWADLLVELG